MKLLTPKPRGRKHSSEDKIQKIFEELRQKHSTKYTTMQLRTWAEMVNSGMHVSMVDAPI